MIIIVILCFIVFIYFAISIKAKFSLPIGPIGLPYFGYAIFLNSPTFKSLFDLRKKFGKIFSFTAFGKNVLVVNDCDLIKEVLLKRREFSGRTTLFINGLLSDKRGISNYDGVHVDVKRKIIQNFLKMNEGFENVIDRETIYFIDHVATMSGQSVNSRKLYNKAVCNIIWKIVFSKRIDYSNIEALSNVEKVAINNSENEIISFKQFIPNICSQAISNITAIRKLLEMDNIFQRYQNIIKFLKMSINNGESGFRNYLKKSSVSSEIISENEELRLIFELFAAGTDTIILTLQWSTLLLAINPMVQDKMREEIEEFILPNINGDIIVSWSDRSKLRYCQQVITEVHRLASVTPLALPHRITKSCKFSGYQIPEDTIVLFGIYSVHHDPDIWQEPESFLPSRFDDKSLSEKIIPFSLGRRTCPGSVLAQAEIFTILLNVVYNFQLIPVKENLTIEDLGPGTPGLTRAPNYHEVIFKQLRP